MSTVILEPKKVKFARGHRRCQYNPESRPASPKRPPRSQSPEAAEPLEALTSKLSNQMGALEVVLDELRAPGGAFLPVATDRTEPTASQRAWLTWQLTHEAEKQGKERQ